jgi:alpha-D-ribose 1-methylphosphonate 5-triphosphate diphosphatase
MVLPGIIDIHGDAFERQIQPRPGIDFPDGPRAARTPNRQLLLQRHHHRLPPA